MANIQQLKRIGFDVDKFKTEWDNTTYNIRNAKQIRHREITERITSSGRRFHESKISKIKRGVYHGIIEENEK